MKWLFNDIHNGNGGKQPLQISSKVNINYIGHHLSHIVNRQGMQYLFKTSMIFTVSAISFNGRLCFSLPGSIHQHLKDTQEQYNVRLCNKLCLAASVNVALKMGKQRKNN